MNILFLSTWYPHRYDPMDGLFVRKHAQAVSRQEGCEVDVLYICQRTEVDHPEFVQSTTDGINELIYYHPPYRSPLDGFRATYRAWKEWHNRRQLIPDIVHLNVISKLGWIALFLKLRHHIPYVITEHWSGYLPQNGDFKGWERVGSAKIIARHAAAIMPVSEKLASAMKEKGLKNPNYSVVLNAIDDFFFDKTERPPHSEFRFLHVSCFDNRPKNTKGIITAVAKLAATRSDFEMIMAGDGPDRNDTMQYAERCGLTAKGIVKFTGTLTPHQVKEWMCRSDCFVLFSNYESASVVLQEASACGMPIITSDAGNARQIVTPERGIIIPPADTDALCQSMAYIMDHSALYNPDIIRRGSEVFSFDNIGHSYLTEYQKAINHLTTKCK